MPSVPCDVRLRRTDIVLRVMMTTVVMVMVVVVWLDQH